MYSLLEFDIDISSTCYLLCTVLKKVKHRVVENMNSGTADALGLSRAILCNGQSCTTMCVNVKGAGNVDLYSAYSQTPLTHSGMIRVIKRSHSFTCTPRIHLLAVCTIPACEFSVAASVGPARGVWRRRC